MALDIDAVVGQMLQAAEGPLQQYWKTAEPAAKAEFTKIAQLIAQIGVDRATNTITPEDAQDDLAEAEEAAQTAIATQAGLGELAAQDAINAAIGAALAAVSGIVNGYLGFALI
jgi:hypothetical protein